MESVSHSQSEYYSAKLKNKYLILTYWWWLPGNYIVLHWKVEVGTTQSKERYIHKIRFTVYWFLLIGEINH